MPQSPAQWRTCRQAHSPPWRAGKSMPERWSGSRVAARRRCSPARKALTRQVVRYPTRSGWQVIRKRERLDRGQMQYEAQVSLHSVDLWPSACRDHREGGDLQMWRVIRCSLSLCLLAIAFVAFKGSNRTDNTFYPVPEVVVQVKNGNIDRSQTW
jgi:hypothetical protein